MKVLEYCKILHHSLTTLSFQNSPFGLPAGKSAQTIGVSAPWSGVKGALSPAMSVFTQPGQQALTKVSTLPERERERERD